MMDTYEAIEVLLTVARDFASLENASGIEVDPYVDAAINVVEDMLAEEQE
jgi:hypothetical protein